MPFDLRHPYSILLWNVRWWRLKPRPPWVCLCGLPQWEWQTNIMKHELSASTRLLGSAPSFWSKWTNTAALTRFRHDQLSALWKCIFYRLSSALWWSFDLNQIHIWKTTQPKTHFDSKSKSQHPVISLFFSPLPFNFNHSSSIFLLVIPSSFTKPLPDEVLSLAPFGD